jgi:ribonuclease G
MSSELFISRVGGRVWAALREDGATVELRTEQEPRRALAGRIIKARVTRVLPGMQSAFLDIGDEHGALLHARDLVIPGRTHEPGTPIEDRLRQGQELLVQIARERLGSKGAKVTAAISIAGRLLVLLPHSGRHGVSRRISDQEERERLHAILQRLPLEHGSFLARTAACGATEGALAGESEALVRTWEEINDSASLMSAPSVVHREPDFLLQLLQGSAAAKLERIVFDNEDDKRQALIHLREIDPALAPEALLHPSPAPLFESYGLQEDIEKALRARVWLKSGGYIVIEETEALVSIDVNTGKFLGGTGLEQTALRTNLEAAVEIGRQLRLRDLGGIIVIDFIDMASAESRRQTLEALQQVLAADSAKTKIVGLSDLGLMQLTRKRTRPSLKALTTLPCPHCRGWGRVRKE